MSEQFSARRVPEGKLRLLQAALRLITSSRSLTSLGIRELARAASLNPNTFYRHFKDLDDFGLFVLDYVAGEVKQQVRLLRQQAASSDQAARDTVAFVYEYFRDNPAIPTVAVRELHGPSAVLRQAIDEQLEQAAREMTEDTVERRLVPDIERSVLLDIARTTVRYMLFRGMDYIEYPDQQDAIRLETVRFLRRQYAGALAEQVSPELMSRLMGTEPG